MSSLLLDRSAYADVGIPVVSYGWPFMIVNLIFVVAIETLVLKLLQRNAFSAKAILKQTAWANVLTTLIGYPVLAVAIAVSAVFGGNLGWLIPFENLDQMGWYVSASLIITLVPCYFLSVWIEGKILRKNISQSISWSHIYLTNLASYAFLITQAWFQFPVKLLTYGHYTFEPSFDVVAAIASLFTNKN